MTQNQLRAMEAILSNDEASTDTELLRWFVEEIGVTHVEAEKMICRRDEYLTGIKIEK